MFLVTVLLVGFRPSYAGDDLLDPVYKEAQIIVNSIYDVGKWVASVPYKLAFPIIARAKLTEMVRALSLPNDVRKRVMARIESKQLVDEIVPFLIAIKDLYMPSGDFKSKQKFDDYFRRNFSPKDAIPGVEHTMFQWQKESSDDQDDSGFGLDNYVISQLVIFYDAVYLRDNKPNAMLDDQFSCNGIINRQQLQASTKRAKSSVRDLLQYVHKLLPEEHEYKEAVGNAYQKSQRLEAITVSLIEFVGQQVCKHYRMFATSVFRQQQLSTWMLDELEKESDGEESGLIWRYLEYANSHRRYAMHIMIDGLQGHLVKTLAGGNEQSSFIKKIMQDFANAQQLAPLNQSSQSILDVLQDQDMPSYQNRNFVRRFAEQGYEHKHYLSFFRDLYQDSNHDASQSDQIKPYGIAVNGISTTPTISVRNLPIIQTGAPVAGSGSTGIPNFHFVDRNYVHDGEHRGRPYYFFGNDALQLEKLTRQSGMQTLFERLPRLLSFNCGAQYDIGAYYTVDAFVSLGVGEQIRDFGDIICISELEKRAANEVKLRTLRQQLLDMQKLINHQHKFWEWYDVWGKRNTKVLARRLINQIAELEQHTLPENFLYYNPWVDHFAHFKGPFSDEIISPSGELNRLDYWLQRYTQIYKKAGVFDRTLFGMASDHGLTPVFHVLNPENEIFIPLRQDGIDFKVIKISSDEGGGPKLNNDLNPPSMKGIDVVVASTAGGNYMLDMFLDQDNLFSKQPLYQDLLNVTPLKYKSVSGFKPLDFVNIIYQRLSESLDYMVLRETKCTPQQGTIRLIGELDGRQTQSLIERRGKRIFYNVNQEDLLGDLLDTQRLTSYAQLDAQQQKEHSRLYLLCHARKNGSKMGAVYTDAKTWCLEQDWRQLTSYTDRPDSVVQLAHLYDTDRAGTINLFPKQGIGYNTKVPGRHAGEHFHEKDAFVGFWGVPVLRNAQQGRLQSVVNGSMPIAIYEYLSATTVREGDTGWGFTALGEVLFK